MIKMLIGYQENLPIKDGDIVIVPKGTKVKSTHPKIREYVTQKNIKVLVNHTLPGQSIGDNPIKNPSIRWAGTGGYWCEVDVNDVVKE